MFEFFWDPSVRCNGFKRTLSFHIWAPRECIFEAFLLLYCPSSTLTNLTLLWVLENSLNFSLKGKSSDSLPREGIGLNRALWYQLWPWRIMFSERLVMLKCTSSALQNWDFVGYSICLCNSLLVSIWGKVFWKPEGAQWILKVPQFFKHGLKGISFNDK